MTKTQEAAQYENDNGGWFTFDWGHNNNTTLYVPGAKDEVDLLGIMSDPLFKGWLAVRTAKGKRFFLNTSLILAFEAGKGAK